MLRRPRLRRRLMRCTAERQLVHVAQRIHPGAGRRGADQRHDAKNDQRSRSALHVRERTSMPQRVNDEVSCPIAGDSGCYFCASGNRGVPLLLRNPLQTSKAQEPGGFSGRARNRERPIGHYECGVAILE